jgi:AcrR family transcriptional regulator
MEKTDIRVRFTQKVLQESLLALMKEKSILDITIKEICEGAGLSRSTFYMYYKDQYDLLRQIEEQTFNEAEIIVRLAKMKKKPSVREISVIFENTLQFIADNSNSIQVLLSENGDRSFQKKFFRRGIESSGKFTEIAAVTLRDKKDILYSSVYIVSGVIALIQEWLKNGMDMPVPEMAKLLARLTRERWS